MQRYFAASAQFQSNKVTITGDDARHMMKVMRNRPGDRFIASDGENREVLAEIRTMSDDEVIADIIEERTMENEPLIPVWIAQALPKADKMETVIQKCTEIGAARVIPFVSTRTIVQYDARKEAKRLERWRKIAKEAAEQSHRNRIPVIDAPLSWKQLLGLIPQTGKTWICYEKETARGLKSSLRAYMDRINPPPLDALMLIVGPEGGFEPQEVAEAEAAGGECIGLGKRILRTETAAMTALSCILYEYDEIGGNRNDDGNAILGGGDI